MYAQVLILFFLITSNQCAEDLRFKIGLPQYVCDKNGGVRDVSRDMTTIRLLGKNTQAASYKFDVTFNRIGNKCHNNQRCTLMMWRTVRDLEKYLKNYPTERMRTGLIEINNTMFLPGVKYLLNVTIFNEGTVVEEKQFTLDYVDEDAMKTIQKPRASIALVGPNTSFAYATYIVNAEVVICSNVSSYNFNWQFVDEDGNITQWVIRGAELTVLPNTFKGAQKYTIHVDLVADGTAIAFAEQVVDVLSKGLILKLPFKSMTTKTGQSVRIRPYIRDLDNRGGTMQLKWSCIDIINNEDCQYQSDTSELEMDSAFQNPGKYKISLEVSKNDKSQNESCIVEVMDDVPFVEIEEIETPVSPSSGVEIHANIYELKVFCTLQWTSVNDDGYEFLDLSTVPGNPAEIGNITTKEDVFLNELEEFSSDSVDKDFNLIIPPPSEDESWDGLKGDTKYLFRLEINCPQTSDDLNDTLAITITTVTTDVEIETNAAPAVQPLQVNPVEGEAFLTPFNFATEKAVDKDDHGPILYNFGYILNGIRNVVLCNLADVTTCEVTLPYSEEGIQTFLECCDNFNSCGRVLGPLVQTKWPQNINFEQIKQKFVTKMNNGEYTKAFYEALSIIGSYTSQENSTELPNVRDFISKSIEEEIDKFLNLEDSTWRNSANELITNINEFNADLQLPETLLNKLVELRNKISGELENYIQRKLLWYELPRPKRDTALSLQDIRSYIDVSELIITTSNDSNKVNLEKENLRKQLHTYMQKLCFNSKKTHLHLELKTLIFAVEKLNKNSLNNLISIPFEGNSWHIIARIKLGNALKSGGKAKCMGKALFRDYLGKRGIVYFAELMNMKLDEPVDVVVLLPKNKSLEGSPRCIVYRDGWRSDCKTLQNIANYIKCSCKYFGYYYVEYDQIPVPTTESRPSPLPTTAFPFITERILNGNESFSAYEAKYKPNYETISYVVIVGSIIGIIVLTVILRKIFHDDDDNEENDTFEFPKYAQLHDEEFLTDAHI